MRKFTSLAGAALLAAVSLVTPASSVSAAEMAQAGGSCGPAVGNYAMDNADAADFPGGGTTTPALFFKVDYSGLPAPTTVGIIRYYNDMQSYQGVSTFVAQGSGGSFESAVRANINPAAQGAEGSQFPKAGRADGPVTSQKGAGGSGSSGYGGGGGLMPGNYIFQVYTGALEQTPNGPVFVTSPSGYLGTFTCGVSD
ncbi:MAG: hypothetical protein IT305_05515 [Chloroflexi bacterium]|nr:hypothetical protein [Chloroflexota bacterium]